MSKAEPINIDALLALEAKATPGDWVQEATRAHTAHMLSVESTEDDADTCDEKGRWWAPIAEDFFKAEDAAFVAAARNAIRPLCMEVRELRGQGWQPIETAPKGDGSVLLHAIGADKRPMIVIARWECGRHAHLSRRVCPRPDCDFRWLGELGTHYGVTFTNWMPLPKPPELRECVKERER